MKYWGGTREHWPKHPLIYAPATGTWWPGAGRDTPITAFARTSGPPSATRNDRTGESALAAYPVVLGDKTLFLIKEVKGVSISAKARAVVPGSMIVSSPVINYSYLAKAGPYPPHNDHQRIRRSVASGNSLLTGSPFLMGPGYCGLSLKHSLRDCMWRCSRTWAVE